MNTRDAKAACLAVGLATAWAACPAPASADTRIAQVVAAPSTTISHVHFLYSGNSSGSPYFASSRKLADVITVGASWSLKLPVEVKPDAWAWKSGQSSYTIVGIYDGDLDGDIDGDDASMGAVAMLFGPDVAGEIIGQAQTWAQIFPSVSLQHFAGIVWEDDDEALAQFMLNERQWRFPGLGSIGSLVEFIGSAAPAQGGSALAEKLRVGMNNKAAWDPVVESDYGNYTTCLWGRLRADNEYSFAIDDGSGKPITIYCSDWASVVKAGDYVRVSGALYAYSGYRYMSIDTSKLEKLD